MVSTPHTVTATGGKTHVLVMNATDGLPAAFALMGTTARDKVAVRLSGGCKGMSAADKAAMLDYFAAAFDGFGGVVWSGGTRQTDSDGALDPMVTDVPGVIAAKNARAVALGTVPRVALLSLQGESRLVLDEYGTGPNPTMQAILVVQNGPDGELGWDGDVATYFALMEQWRNHAGFSALGLIGWNGGAVTEDEILRAARKRWPTILVRGTGRATDDVIGKVESGKLEELKVPADHRIVVVDRADPATLRTALSAHGFLPVAQA